MKKIHMILIFICLTEQLKADVYTVEVNDVFGGVDSLGSVNENPDSTFMITFLNDVNGEDVHGEVFSLHPIFPTPEYTFVRYPCDMDTSTTEGTLAAILWSALGIDSCPIKAGDYSTVQKFNQTGILVDMFIFLREYKTISISLVTYGNRYFRLLTTVRLVEKSP